MKTKNILETKQIAEILLRKISASQEARLDATTQEHNYLTRHASLITLSGDLGTGKTTFTQQIGELLKIKEKINSPTFVISKTYNIKSKSFPWKKLIHLDAYRLEREEDLELIGLKEQLKNPENLIFLEWPEMIKKWLPKENRIDVKLKYIDENTREIKF